MILRINITTTLRKAVNRELDLASILSVKGKGRKNDDFRTSSPWPGGMRDFAKI
jgi:hypothetical protein